MKLLNIRSQGMQLVT